MARRALLRAAWRARCRCKTLDLPPKEARFACVECLVGNPKDHRKDTEPVELFKAKFLSTIRPLLDALDPEGRTSQWAR